DRDAVLRGLAAMKYPKGGAIAAKAIRAGDLSEPALQLAKSSPTEEVIAALEAAQYTSAISMLAELRSDRSIPKIVAALNKPDLRSAAIKALASLKAKTAVPDILHVASGPDAILALAEIPDARATDLFLTGLSERRMDVRAAARKALTALREEAWTHIEPKLKSLPPAAVAELQRIYRNDPRAANLHSITVDRLPPQAYFDFAANNSGDAERGEKIFKDRNGVSCINCHRVRGDGVDIGPDLSGVGAQFDRRALAESVLFPSRAVREGYNVVDLELTDGDVVSGMIRAETSESISIQAATGAPQTIPKSKIKSRKSTAVSLMPEGLEAALSLDEFSDLISFLQSLRSGT
ncbi:MAG TPA: c-type cytochrome, partial [Verrucomicrobiae bacterium]|nr:c-type cytochrome [Verrucomicrobiae bacterium]